MSIASAISNSFLTLLLLFSIPFSLSLSLSLSVSLFLHSAAKLRRSKRTKNGEGTKNGCEYLYYSALAKSAFFLLPSKSPVHYRQYIHFRFRELRNYIHFLTLSIKSSKVDVVHVYIIYKALNVVSSWLFIKC